MTLGVALCCTSYILIGTLPNSLPMSLGLIFAYSIGFTMFMVMCDTLVVENVQLETAERKGSLQSSCWILLTLGTTIGSVGGAYSAKCLGNKDTLLITGFLNLIILPLTLLLRDQKVVAGNSEAP